MSARDAARCRWRADLHEYGAAAMRSAGLEAMADENAARAVHLREYADLLDELAAAKAAREANPSPETREAVKEVSTRIDAFRVAAADNQPPQAAFVNNFSEPTDAELIEMGY